MQKKKKKLSWSEICHKFQKRMAALQEAQFDRGEEELRKIVGDDEELEDYPIPTFVVSILIWGFILSFPLLLILDPSNLENTITVMNMVTYYVPLISTMVIFFVNQRYLIPNGFFKRRYIIFFLGNGLMIFLALFARELSTFFVLKAPTDTLIEFFRDYCFRGARTHFSIWTVFFFFIVWAMVCFISVLISSVMRIIVRSFMLREKKKNTLEYELNFLKQQLSPHFLFNTLNNIMSLIRIDPLLAENSMAKLSGLLRLMIYQTSDKFITIEEDISILQKYAELERLRLDENFDLSFDVSLENPKRKVEPLLAMPLMENAMKHCINPDGKSFARIRIFQKGNTLTFESENSNFPRKQKPNASGLGLNTFKKRLELMYNEKFTYENFVENGIYKSKLSIELKEEMN